MLVIPRLSATPAAPGIPTPAAPGNPLARGTPIPMPPAPAAPELTEEFSALMPIDLSAPKAALAG